MWCDGVLMAKEWEVEIVDLVCTVEGNTRKASQERVRPPWWGEWTIRAYTHTMAELQLCLASGQAVWTIAYTYSVFGIGVSLRWDGNEECVCENRGVHIWDMDREEEENSYNPTTYMLSMIS